MPRPTNSQSVPLSRAASPVSVPAIPDNTQQQQQPQCKSPLPTPSLKETRAFEHDRQQLKKSAVFLSRKARRAEAKTQPVVNAKPQPRQSRGAGVRHRVDVRCPNDDDDEPVAEVSEIEWGEARSLSLRLGPPADAEWETEGTLPRRAEVSLSDFVITRKPRHGRDHAEFEVVPHIRSVIVLDDITVPEIDFDEPWEHVYASDSDDTHVSYAKIAALN